MAWQPLVTGHINERMVACRLCFRSSNAGKKLVFMRVAGVLQGRLHNTSWLQCLGGAARLDEPWQLCYTFRSNFPKG